MQPVQGKYLGTANKPIILSSNLKVQGYRLRVKCVTYCSSPWNNASWLKKGQGSSKKSPAHLSQWQYWQQHSSSLIWKDSATLNHSLYNGN